MVREWRKVTYTNMGTIELRSGGVCYYPTEPQHVYYAQHRGRALVSQKVSADEQFGAVDIRRKKLLVFAHTGHADSRRKLCHPS